MKINHLIPAFAAILGLAVASAPVKAQTTNAAPAAAPAAAKATKTKPTSYAGSITAISATSLTVQTKKDSLVLAIGADTKFATIGADKKKTPAQASDFAVGDNVTGSYTKGADGSLTANSVHKKAAK